VAIIAILIGGVFQLMSTVGSMNQKAVTQARMQRIQNAISGFYAEYGYYPPVPQYTSPDPWGANLKNDFDQPIQNLSTEDGFAQACSYAAASQPVAFEFPPVTGLDPYINKTYQQWNIQSPNSLLGSTADTITQDEWSKIKLFKFGLLSFLLPRVEVVGFTGAGTANQSLEPDTHFYESRQWKKNNPVSNVSSTRKALEAQQIIENRAVARWLPNLEGVVMHGRNILGIDTRESNTAGDEGGYRVAEVKDSKGTITDMLSYEHNGKYVLQFMSLRDGWGKELYYYSAPPYQSYRLWSAGKDGKTFPPWIPLNSLSSQERTWVSDWLKDDIVRFDR
jgi:type II secretory pathway pseudopilin PulG